jgi:sec-independent protein translocase protein TatA
MFGLPGGMEWVILALVAVLIFGGTRLAGIGKGAGRAIREFKEETQGLSSKDKTDAATPDATAPRTVEGGPDSTSEKPNA